MSERRLEEQRRHTLAAIHAAGTSVQDVWIRYFALAGDPDEYNIDAYRRGLMPLPVLD